MANDTMNLSEKMASSLCGLYCMVVHTEHSIGTMMLRSISAQVAEFSTPTPHGGLATQQMLLEA